LVLVDDASGSISVAKVLTTPSEPATGVGAGIKALLEASGSTASSITRPVHGATTLVTNAIIERRGEPTALLATRGFRDILEIGREWRYDIYDLSQRKLEPLVPRELRFEVTERMEPDGTVAVALDEADLERVAGAIHAAGIRAIAVCFLNSFANPEHELAAAERLRALIPDAQVVTSAEVAPEIREYERTSTAVACAYVVPGIGRHFRRLQETVEANGIETPVYLMHSSGGIVSLDTAARFPIKLIESGPAAGVLGAAFVGRQSGIPNLMSFDMGGTTAKLCCITDGQPTVVRDFEAARIHRFTRGSGMPLLVPVIDLTEIGAGGGSIARIDPLGLLAVGPESAGAEPGPVSYGRGGAEPTVTDANLLLGFIDPDYFLGGGMKIDRDAARDAVESRLAGPLGVDAVAAAAGVVRVVNENMANAAKIHLAERGLDPRSYSLIAFGGAGALHGGELARSLGIRELVYPMASGALSALGLLAAPVAIDFQQTAIWPLASAPWDRVTKLLEQLETRAIEALADTGARRDEASIVRSVEMRYVGQGYSVTVVLPEMLLDARAGERIASAFEEIYGRLYGNLNPNVPIEFTTWWVSVEAPGSQPSLTRRQGITEGNPEKGKRPIYSLRDEEWVDAAVIDHYLVSPGYTFEGPAVVEQRESTCLIAPGDRAVVDEQLNVRVQVASP
ncbi:MAG TPA: hydantoinase/oxoprolinase family protein, partial [Gaiellaceae bacterium]